MKFLLSLPKSEVQYMNADLNELIGSVLFSKSNYINIDNFWNAPANPKGITGAPAQPYSN